MKTKTHAKLLLADDDRQLGESFKDILEAKGYQVSLVEDGDYALDLIESEEFDAVITDFQMPTLGGMELLEKASEFNPGLPIIIMTAFSSAERAIEATKNGAYDFLIKPVEIPELLEVVGKAVESRRLTAKAITIGESSPGKDAIIGASRSMQKVFKEIGRIAENPIPILITGETGTGKELIARAIFQHSKRSNKPFIAVNCASIPENLLESELFGHERGSFTGAVSRRIGRFEQANGGTLFLDEIGDLPWQTQVKLLRVLQEKCLSRVGSPDSIAIDVRIISATHSDLPAMISNNEFREDLFFRLNAAQISLPPLRERRDDIPALTDYLLSKYAQEFEMETPSIHTKARKKLSEHRWPGNVRELENVVRKSLIDAQGRTISLEIVTKAITAASYAKSSEPSSSSPQTSGRNQNLTILVQKTLEEASEGKTDDQGAFPFLVEKIEEEMFRQAVEFCHHNQSKMAKLLGLSRLTVREKLDKYALLPKRGKSEID